MDSVKWLGRVRQEPFPPWAFGRPRPVVTTLLNRLAQGSSTTFLITVVDLNMGQFQVQKSDATLTNLMQYYILATSSWAPP